jgi:hypothetical protein
MRNKMRVEKKMGLDTPCDGQIDFMIKNFLVVLQGFPRWPSIRANATIVPSSLIGFLLQNEVIQFDNVCVLHHNTKQ